MILLYEFLSILISLVTVDVCHLISVILSLPFCFFFKQTTAYELRISDWSSDVCSSDLAAAGRQEGDRLQEVGLAGAVRAGQHHHRAVEVEAAAAGAAAAADVAAGGRVVADRGQRQATHGEPARAGGRSGLRVAIGNASWWAREVQYGSLSWLPVA